MLTRVQNWLAHPFTSDMDAWGWAIFTLFIMVLAFMWTRVLALITEEI